MHDLPRHAALILLIAAMAMSVNGCGGGDDGGAPSPMEPLPGSGSAPILSALDFDSTAACPDDELVMAFQFTDLDSDAETFHVVVRHATPIVDSLAQAIPVHIPGGECMQGFAGACEFTVFSYENFDGGESINVRVWVEDAQGHSSNVLIADFMVADTCGTSPGAVGKRLRILANGAPRP